MNIRLIKKMCNGVVLTMFLFSVVMLARYSDLPNYFSIQFLNKPESPSNIGMSLYTSFIVTAVFYFFMNLVPDLVNAAEKEKRELPKRIDMSNVSNPDGKYLTWENAIYNILDCLMYKCNRIFQLYSGQLPENVHFYLNYLLQEDQLMNGLYSNVKMFYNQVNEWTNSEYDYIKEKGGLNISDRIFPVKI